MLTDADLWRLPREVGRQGAEAQLSLCVCCRMLTYAAVSSRKLTYADLRRQGAKEEAATGCGGVGVDGRGGGSGCGSGSSTSVRGCGRDPSQILSVGRCLRSLVAAPVSARATGTLKKRNRKKEKIEAGALYSALWSAVLRFF